MPISRDRFNAIKAKMTTYLQNKEIFVFDGLAGTDPTKTKKIDGVYSEAAIMTDYEAKMVLIAGFQYSGEIKKVIFPVMNLLLPLKGIGTERHIRKPVPTCSTLFGEPFIPMDPNIYVKMLGDKLDKYNPQVYLVITGWTGGPYGTGIRMNLKYTRPMITAVLHGELEKIEYKHNDTFNLGVPQHCPHVPSIISNRRDTWEDKAAYTTMAKKLAGMFYENALQSIRICQKRL